MNNDYQIKSASDILKRFKFPRFHMFLDCWSKMLYSAQKSKVNLLFQFINLVVTIFLVIFIIPARLEHWFSGFFVFEVYFLPLGRMVTIFLSWLCVKCLSWIFDFSIGDIFTTSFKITIWITLGLLALVVLMFQRLFFIFISNFKKDLMLWTKTI